MNSPRPKPLTIPSQSESTPDIPKMWRIIPATSTLIKKAKLGYWKRGKHQLCFGYPPNSHTTAHSSGVTGWTDRRMLLTKTMSFRRSSDLHISRVTGSDMGPTALISTHSQRASSVVLSGCAKAQTSTTPTIPTTTRPVRI